MAVNDIFSSLKRFAVLGIAFAIGTMLIQLPYSVISTLRDANVARLFSGALSIDKEAKQVFLRDKQVALTVKEYELLVLLAENPQKTLNKEYLFHQVWGMDSFSENQTLTVHIKTLRDKIEDNPKKPLRIKTIWGVGYQYEEI